MFAHKVLDGIKFALIVVRDDECLNDENGMGLPWEVMRFGVVVETAGERHVACVGGEVGEGE